MSSCARTCKRRAWPSMTPTRRHSAPSWGASTRAGRSTSASAPGTSSKATSASWDNAPLVNLHVLMLLHRIQRRQRRRVVIDARNRVLAVLLNHGAGAGREFGIARGNPDRLTLLPRRLAFERRIGTAEKPECNYARYAEPHPCS